MEAEQSDGSSLICMQAEQHDSQLGHMFDSIMPTHQFSVQLRFHRFSSAAAFLSQWDAVAAVVVLVASSIHPGAMLLDKVIYTLLANAIDIVLDNVIDRG